MVDNMKYMREGLKDKYRILELQDKIMEIAVYLNSFCGKYNISYCLMGGSALGAKRHKGFIPWDDDLDIFMTPDNYEKFRKYFDKYGDKEKFYLQEYGLQDTGMVTVPKLRMNNTLYEEELTKDWKIHQGIFVDILILHICPNSKIKQLWQCFWAKCVVVKGMSMRGYNRQTGFRKFVLVISKALPKSIMIKYALKQVYRFRNQNSNWLCHFLGKAIYKKGLYKKEWFETTKLIQFEKVHLRAPCGLEDYLTERFGDYTQIPSDDQIKWDQHATKWSGEYYNTSENNEYLDEIYLV